MVDYTGELRDNGRFAHPRRFYSTPRSRLRWVSSNKCDHGAQEEPPRREAENRLVAIALKTHFAAEHSEQKGEVSESQGHSDDPPGEADRKAVPGRGGIVDREVVGRIGARRQYDGIQSEGCAHKHPHD